MTYFHRHACRFIILAAYIAFGAQGAAAQDVLNELTEIDISPATARGCQRNTINIANLSASLATTKERVFVVARLGTGESSRQLNHRRLNDVKTQFGQNKGTEKVILTEGERVKGQGRLEFYLGSEIVFISLFARNGDFCAACCDRKERFYKNPYKQRSNIRRRR